MALAAVTLSFIPLLKGELYDAILSNSWNPPLCLRIPRTHLTAFLFACFKLLSGV